MFSGIIYSSSERFDDDDEDNFGEERYDDEDRDEDVDGDRSDELLQRYQQDPAKSKCHQKCGTGVHHAAGKCQSNGVCLCWWGWTGDNARYINGGKLNNRILADFCTRPCHFTHVVR